MDIEQFARRMVELIPQIIKGFTRYENNYLTSGRISLPQFWVLEYLLREGESKMTQVAQRLGVSKPAATGLIDRLISQELVARHNDLEDRRLVWIALTAKGKKIIQNIWQQKRQAMVNVFGRISAVDRGEHLRLFEELAKILSGPEIPPARTKDGKKGAKA